MRTLSLAKRIIIQIFHDKRTMALILIAPIIVLTMIYFILQAENTHYVIGADNACDAFVKELESNEDYDITVKDCKESEIKEKINENELDGAVVDNGDDVKIYVSGTDASVAARVQAVIKTARAKIAKDEYQEKIDDIKDNLKKMQGKTGLDADELEQTEIDYKVTYVGGAEDASLFDKFGTQLIGIIVFFFVFLIAGINFLTERSSGTMEKLLSTPIRRYEIVLGYILGFSVLALLQSVFVTLFVVYVLGLTIQGNIFLVLAITLLTAINALIFGILLSTVANSEFQMMQFIPIVILPQIFLCGLFRVSGVWDSVGHIMPLYYTSHALTEVMMKGNGLCQIYQDILVLLGFSIVLYIANVLLLKKQRAI